MNAATAGEPIADSTSATPSDARLPDSWRLPCVQPSDPQKPTLAATDAVRAIDSARDKSNARGNRGLQTRERQQRLETPGGARFVRAASNRPWQGRPNQLAPAPRLIAEKYELRRLRPAAAAECSRRAAHRAGP